MKMPLLQNGMYGRISIALSALLILLLLPLSWMYGRASAMPAVGKAAIDEIVRITQAHTLSSARREMAYIAAFAKKGDGESPDVSGDTQVKVISVTKQALSFAVTDIGEDLSPYGRTVYYNLDPSSGAHLTLGDVLGEGWRETVAEAVCPMIAADEDTYEGIDVSPMINEERMFCVTGEGRMEIIFDLGEIAPDAAGIKTYPIAVGE